jgi:hypothetical protein
MGDMKRGSPTMDDGAAMSRGTRVGAALAQMGHVIEFFRCPSSNSTCAIRIPSRKPQAAVSKREPDP